MKPLVISTLFAFVAMAQEPAVSFRGMTRMNRAPVSNEVLKVKLPRPVERQLSNGIRLLILESHRGPTVTLTISMPSSPLRDPAGLPGVAEATAALMMTGTKTRTARQISETLADLGATVTFSSGAGGGGGRGGRGGGGGEGGGTISVSALSENFDAALAVMSDVLLHPSFPADEFEKWKTRQRSAIEQARTSPTGLGSEMLMKVLYPSDARQFTRLTGDSLNKLTRDNLLEHYKQFYVPSGELAGIVGDITPRDAVAALEKALGAWKGGPVAKITLPVSPPIAEKKVYLVSRPGSVQTDLVLANRAIDRTSADYIACLVMNQVLGSGPAARLFRIIREEKGYTYGVSSSFTATRYLQHFSSSMLVRTEVTEPALADLLKEFKEIRDVPVPKEELEGAKRTLVASFALGLENPAGVLQRWMQQREFALPADYWDTYTEKIAAVTAEEVARVAKKYVPYDNVQIIAVGDGAKIRELLKKFGPVEESTADSQ
ncbi:putative Mitochondrial processing peptidase [Candidatus Sulfopaludibacter sp. SbA3]|nr:putative Mitochondrial processing peptidase [Candidatus Sulfopaludibacter sp. SbA3]